ncbi:MAG: transporter substrate-binding domain-containing protein [Chitinophagaceae bacterium]|nr:transporter substrate-binding domain-containing protein [Anaerolineae bacterium]
MLTRDINFYALGVSILIVMALTDIRVVGQGAPTLVPPTPVPTLPSANQELLAPESAVARIQRDNKVRVGILYNAPPYGELNVRGIVSGFDADIANSMKDAWGVEIEFVQVTRNVAATVQMLQNGTVDLVMSALIHRRDLDSMVEFSQTYYIDRQAMMVRSDDPATTLAEMAGRNIGVVVATPAEAALTNWLQRTGVSANLQTFLTLDRAYVALATGTVDGIVGTEAQLRRISASQVDSVKVLEEALEFESHAMAFRRQDTSMRDLINRTLQYLTSTGRMNEIKQVHFPGSNYDTIRPWRNLGDQAPTPAQSSLNLTYPTQYVIPRLQADRILRVAGLFGITADDTEAPESRRRLDTLNRAIIDELARRWGVTVTYIPDSATNAIELVTNGQADIAVGITPDWNVVGQVDFSGYYLVRGDRLIAKVRGETEGFVGLRGGRIVATDINDPEAVTRMRDAADGNVEPYQTRESDFALAILDELNADVAFGDSLQLIPHLEQYPDLLQITDQWYSQNVVVMALPRNDLDFRLLVDYSLQELARDGTLARLLQPVMLPNDVPLFEMWPGTNEFMGFSLTGTPG